MANTFTPYSPSGAPMETPIDLLNDGGVLNFDDFMATVIEPLIDGVGLAQTTLGISSTPVERIISVQWNTGESGEFAFATGTNFDTWVDAANSGSRIQCEITNALPHGCTLHSVTVYINPAAHANLPASLPILNVISIVASTNSGGSEGSGTDTSADAAAYQVYHRLSAIGIDAVINRTTTAYFLGFISEHGANSAPGLALYGRVKLNYSF